MEKERSRHLRISDPSPWLVRFAPLIKAGGNVLDLACGGGRHGRYLLDLGYNVTFIDRDISAVADLKDHAGAKVIEADLEQEKEIFTGSGPLSEHRFDAVVVINYLHRPLLGDLMNAIGDNGMLVYETFARGNERYTRPRNPDHLLKSGELLGIVKGRMQVISYEHGIVEEGAVPGVISGVVQRICAVSEPGRRAERRAGSRPGKRPDRREAGEPNAQFIYPLMGTSRS